MKCLILDNYDSFTYNLRQMVDELGVETVVYRNDKIALEKVAAYDKIILSPGPGLPSDIGILVPLIERYAPIKSILGVSLGVLAIGEAFGAQLSNLNEVFHGVCSDIRILVKDKLFSGLEPGFCAGRYHSYVISKEGLPECLQITAIDAINGYIMGIRHTRYDVCGIQFHPESLLTPQGEKILSNWLYSPFEPSYNY